MVIEKGRAFKALPTLKRWLQAFAVIQKRPYKVLQSYAEHCYKRDLTGLMRNSEK